jgi:hypothetical protein
MYVAVMWVAGQLAGCMKHISKRINIQRNDQHPFYIENDLPIKACMNLQNIFVNFLIKQFYTNDINVFKSDSSAMSKKRRIDATTQDKIMQGLQVPGASERAVNDLWNIWHDDGDRIASSQFKRLVGDKLEGWTTAAKQIVFDRFDGTKVTLPLMRLRPCLEKMTAESTAFTRALERALAQNEFLTPVFYSDECTAGNVLSAEKAKKAVLWYMSWLECFHLLKVPTMWICLAAVQTQCLQEIVGGPSMMTAILAETVNDELQPGFTLSGGLQFKQSLKAFYVADMDAIRGTYSIKGSAGLRPCLFCDVVKSNSGLQEHEPSLVDISASSGFKLSSDASIFRQCDRMIHCQTKKELEFYEKATGIVFDEATLMFSLPERTKMPPSRIIPDFMHCYLCNGVASWEVALLLETVYSKTSLTLDLLQEAVVSHAWQASKGAKKTASYIKQLFSPKNFGPGIYKGEGHQTLAILPLLRFYLETMIEPAGSLPESFGRSFKALCDIIAYVRTIAHGLQKVDERSMKVMDRLQCFHHQQFGAAYGEFKPKHHHRLHIPSQWLKAGVVLSAEPLETKHQLYKDGVADRQRGKVRCPEAFSRAVLPRICQRTLDIILKAGLPFWELLPPIKEAELDDKIVFGAPSLQTSLRFSDYNGIEDNICNWSSRSFQISFLTCDLCIVKV